MSSVLQDVHYRIRAGKSNPQVKGPSPVETTALPLFELLGSGVYGVRGLCWGREHRARPMVGAIAFVDRTTVEGVTVCVRCFEGVCLLMAQVRERRPGAWFIVRRAS